MLAIEREHIIRELIDTDNLVIVSDLAEKFEVTEETIRRDLQKLENEGFLKRIYGGAVRVNIHQEVDVAVREKLLIPEKEAIASAAASLINPYDSVFFDGATTTYYIAKTALDKPISVVTNSLMIAQLFSESPKIELVLVGGRYDPSRRVFLGKNTEIAMKAYRFDKTFISCEYVHMDHGITDSSESYAVIRRMAIEQSMATYLAVDNTKFDKTSLALVSDIGKINTLITDTSLNEIWTNRLKELNIEAVSAS